MLRPLAYAYGTLCIFVGFVLWATVRALAGSLVENVWSAVAFLALDIIAAGLGTLAPRVLRAIGEREALREDVSDYEQAIRKSTS